MAMIKQNDCRLTIAVPWCA